MLGQTQGVATAVMPPMSTPSYVAASGGGATATVMPAVTTYTSAPVVASSYTAAPGTANFGFAEPVARTAVPMAPTSFGVAEPVARTTVPVAPVAAVATVAPAAASPMPAGGNPGALPTGVPARPQPPQRLTEGIPDPNAIEQQKTAYSGSLDIQLDQGMKMLEQQNELQKQALRQHAEQQINQFNIQVDQELRAQEMNVDQQANYQLMSLQQAAHEQRALLEQQANTAILDFEKKKVQDEFARQQYEYQKKAYDKQLEIETEMSKHRDAYAAQAKAMQEAYAAQEAALRREAAVAAAIPMAAGTSGLNLSASVSYGPGSVFEGATAATTFADPRAQVVSYGSASIPTSFAPPSDVYQAAASATTPAQANPYMIQPTSYTPSAPSFVPSTSPATSYGTAPATYVKATTTTGGSYAAPPTTYSVAAAAASYAAPPASTSGTAQVP